MHKATTWEEMDQVTRCEAKLNMSVSSGIEWYVGYISYLKSAFLV